MSQITLVSDEHDDNIGIRMIPELFQPPGYIVIGLVLADVVNKECTNGASVVGRCDSTVSFLPCGIPNLCLDGFGVNLDGSCCEFDADG